MRLFISAVCFLCVRFVDTDLTSRRKTIRSTSGDSGIASEGQYGRFCSKTKLRFLSYFQIWHCKILLHQLQQFFITRITPFCTLALITSFGLLLTRRNQPHSQPGMLILAKGRNSKIWRKRLLATARGRDNDSAVQNWLLASQNKTEKGSTECSYCLVLHTHPGCGVASV